MKDLLAVYLSSGLASLIAVVALGFAAAPVGAQAPAHRVPICHIPPGNPSNFRDIVVDEHAAPAHLAHGDSAGRCADNCNLNPASCVDPDACRIATCDSATGACRTTGRTCDDGNLCTTDSCDPARGCQSEPVVCPRDHTCDPQSGECCQTCFYFAFAPPVSGQCDELCPSIRQSVDLLDECLSPQFAAEGISCDPDSCGACLDLEQQCTPTALGNSGPPPFPVCPACGLPDGSKPDCVLRRPGELCTADYQCVVGRCADGVCAPLLPLGASCIYSAQCQPSRAVVCQEGVCVELM
jgi:hypothetical protein